MKTSDLLTYKILSIFSGIVQRLQVRTRYRAAYYIYSALYRFVPIRQALALKNIKHAYPDKSKEWHQRVLKRSYMFFSRSFLEFFALPKSYIPGSFTVKNREILDRAIELNKGVILIAGHMGPWEMMAAWIGYNNYKFSGIAQRQRNRGADKFFSEKRGESGILHIFRKSGFDKMYDVLKNGNILGVAIDQDAKKRGVIVDFFNLPISVPKGASIFHQKTGAPIVFVNISESRPYNYLLECFNVESEPSDDMRSITQRFTHVMEKYIRNNPEQYFWFHNKFKTTRKLLNGTKN